MGNAMVAHAPSAGGAFRHEAFFYGDVDEFLNGTCAFIEAGSAARSRCSWW